MSLLDRSKRGPILTALLLGAVPVLLTADAFFRAGYPFGGEIFSNLIPAVHARQSISTGELPGYTELFFGGRYQFSNPLWYGFYPPAWILFIPVIPLTVAVKLLIGAHLVAVPLVAYYCLKPKLRWELVVLLSLLWVMPLASQVSAAHLEKIMAWPWDILAAHQLLPDELADDPLRAGTIAGVATGAVFLAGGNYYGMYLLFLVVPVTVLRGSWLFLKRFFSGILVGLPHLLSVLPVLLHRGADRPAPGYGLWPWEMIQLLTGFLNVGFFPTPANVTVPGYAVIGFGACLLALYGGYVALRAEPSWAAGIVTSILVGGLFVGELIYVLPVVDVLRIASRANILIAACLLLLTTYGLMSADFRRRGERTPTVRTFVTILLVLSVVQAGAAWGTFDYSAVQPTVGEAVGDKVAAANCESAWISSTPAWGNRSAGVNSPQIGFVLTQRGVVLQAVHYGRIGQSWQVWNGTQLTFDVLITGQPLPESGAVTLTGADRVSPPHGKVPVDRLGLVDLVQTEEGVVYLYGENGRCN